MLPNRSIVSTSASSQPSPLVATGSGRRTRLAGSTAGPAVVRSAPRASWAATGQNTSRPWNVRDTTGASQSAAAQLDRRLDAAERVRRPGQQAVVRPDQEPAGRADRDAAPGRTHARVDHRDVYGGRQRPHGLREHRRAPGHVTGRYGVRHVDHPGLRRDPGDGAVARATKPSSSP